LRRVIALLLVGEMGEKEPKWLGNWERKNPNVLYSIGSYTYIPSGWDCLYRAAHVKWANRKEQLCLACEAAQSGKRARTMNKIFGIWCAVCLLLILPTSGNTQSPENAQSPENSKLLVAIHYEALCPDSMNFIRRRLYDALNDNNWWSVTDLKLYPFGKAGVSQSQ